MECNVNLGGPSQFELRGAILVYSGGHEAGERLPRGTTWKATRSLPHGWALPSHSVRPS